MPRRRELTEGGLAQVFLRDLLQLVERRFQQRRKILCVHEVLKTQNTVHSSQIPTLIHRTK